MRPDFFGPIHEFQDWLVASLPKDIPTLGGPQPSVLLLLKNFPAQAFKLAQGFTRSRPTSHNARLLRSALERLFIHDDSAAIGGLRELGKVIELWPGHHQDAAWTLQRWLTANLRNAPATLGGRFPNAVFVARHAPVDLMNLGLGLYIATQPGKTQWEALKTAIGLLIGSELHRSSHRLCIQDVKCTLQRLDAELNRYFESVDCDTGASNAAVSTLLKEMEASWAQTAPLELVQRRKDHQPDRSADSRKERFITEPASLQTVVEECVREIRAEVALRSLHAAPALTAFDLNDTPTETAAADSKPSSANSAGTPPLNPQHQCETSPRAMRPRMEQASSSTMSADAASVKTELEPLQADGPCREEDFALVELDMARLAYAKEIHFLDLAAPVQLWSKRLLEKNDPALIVMRNMKPDAAKDHEFPLRDPNNPKRVHPHYASDDGSCHPQVQVLKVDPAFNGMRTFIRNLARSDPFHRLDMSPAEISISFEKLAHDIDQEMRRLIRNEQPAPPAQPWPPRRCEARLLTKDDIQPHEHDLVHKEHGLFALEPRQGTPHPTFRNGCILGLCSGLMIDTQAAYDAHRSMFPDMDAHSIDLNEKGVVLSTLGHANSMAFANTAFAADPTGLELYLDESGRPRYAEADLNALLLPLQITLRDKTGKRRRQDMRALIALDNLYSPSNPSRQVRLDYGPGFLNFMREKIKAAAESAARSERSRRKFKAEPLDTAGQPVMWPDFPMP